MEQAGCSEVDMTEADIDTDSDSFEEFKEKILNDFKTWLDELSIESYEIIHRDSIESEHGTDMLSIMRELVALKQEVRLQSKANRSIGQSITVMGDRLKGSVSESVANLNNAISDVKHQLPEAKREAQREILLEYLAIFEGLQRCINGYQISDVPNFFFSKDLKKRWISKLHEPLEILLSKAEDNLRRLNIRPIASIGAEFDARNMLAIGVTELDGFKSGTVTEVSLQGYLLNETILRTAEVKVQK